MDDKDIILRLLKESNDLLTESNDNAMKEIECMGLEISNYEERIKILENKCDKYKGIILNFKNNIFEYLHEYKSLEKTAERINYDVEELYNDVLHWDKNLLLNLEDYEEIKSRIEEKNK